MGHASWVTWVKGPANRYLQTSEAKDYFGNYQQRPMGSTIAAFTEFHRYETGRWGKIIAAAGIKPEGR